VHTIDHAFIATTRLVPSDDALYATRSDDGIHNLVAVNLASGVLRVVTDNMLPGVTFSGIAPFGPAGFLGVRSERTRDVWLLDAPPARPPASPGKPGRRP